MSVMSAVDRPAQKGGLEIDTARILGRSTAHFGVFDIGAISFGLVVYDSLGRAPFPRFNEKTFPELGDRMDETGHLTADAIARAVQAVRRLDAIARAMQVSRVDILATEAVRRASNGAALITAITRATGREARVLTGAEEASYTALGVIAGFSAPKGLVGDIGGGSLEVAEVLGDRVGARKSSMPLGALVVRALMAEGGDRAKKTIDAELAENLPPLLTEPVLYAVGGGWRALARIHIAMSDAPITVTHGYALDADTARALAKKIARMTPEEVAALPDVPGRRIATLPAAALVMSRVLKHLRPARVVFSAYGLREGWI